MSQSSKLTNRVWRITTCILLIWLFAAVAVTPYGTAQNSKWLTTTTPVVSWANALNYVGQNVVIEGTVVYTKPYGSMAFLDFHYPYQGYFYIYIPSASNFPFSPTSFYLNREVRVTGTITLYKGAPEIIVNSPSQIEVAYMGFNHP